MQIIIPSQSAIEHCQIQKLGFQLVNYCPNTQIKIVSYFIATLADVQYILHNTLGYNISCRTAVIIGQQKQLSPTYLVYIM